LLIEGEKYAKYREAYSIGFYMNSEYLFGIPERSHSFRLINT